MHYKTRTALGVAILVICTGCAHTGTGDPEVDAEREGTKRTRNILIAVGTAIAVGAILANQAESNTRDAIRDAVQD